MFALHLRRGLPAPARRISRERGVSSYDGSPEYRNDLWPDPDRGLVVELTADPCPDEPRTELGYARRLVAVFGERVRYVPAWRRWLIWDGTRWTHDLTGQAARWCKIVARRLTLDALAIVDKEARRAAMHAARRGESAAGVAGALTLAGTEPGIAVAHEDLDADPYLLNCRNGVLDLRTGVLGPHDPKLLLTKITGAAYDPDARGGRFTKFLQRIQPDAEMRDYLARLLGHALAGRVVEHVLPILVGVGANGKSTLIGAIASALGDYAAPADPELLTARSFDAHPTGVADLFGVRLAVLHEGDHGRHLAEGTVKRLTGGDQIKARRMREDFWSFEPSHTFAMLTNHKPIITGTDEGIWRRIRLVPFVVVIPADEQDDELPDKLALEGDAVLAWLVAGYNDWAEYGMDDPAEVIAATADYRAESDALNRFLDERCMTGPNFQVGSSELFAAWCAWCEHESEERGTQTAFAKALQGKGFDNFKDRVGRMRWRGLALYADEETDE
jgi:putative DNA primase/helicase